jgi:hypothetical protein
LAGLKRPGGDHLGSEWIALQLLKICLWYIILDRRPEVYEVVMQELTIKYPSFGRAKGRLNPTGDAVAALLLCKATLFRAAVAMLNCWRSTLRDLSTEDLVDVFITFGYRAEYCNE